MVGLLFFCYAKDFCSLVSTGYVSAFYYHFKQFKECVAVEALYFDSSIDLTTDSALSFLLRKKSV